MTLKDTMITTTTTASDITTMTTTMITTTTTASENTCLPLTRLSDVCAHRRIPARPPWRTDIATRPCAPHRESMFALALIFFLVIVGEDDGRDQIRELVRLVGGRLPVAGDLLDLPLVAVQTCAEPLR